MTSVREMLQVAALKTNPVFPFSQLNRLPYRLAVNRFQSLCGSFAQVRGVYLRHGMTQSSWVPGISDIDLTVSYSKGVGIEDEFRFVAGFRASLKRMRRMLPMLADVEVLDEKLLPWLTKFGTRSLGAKEWLVLSGSAPDFQLDENALQKQRLDDAFCRLFEYLMPWASEPQTYLRKQRMIRAASRILRHAPEDAMLATNEPMGEEGELVAHVLFALDLWVQREHPANDAGMAGEEDSVFLWDGILLLVLGPKRSEEAIRDAIVLWRNKVRGNRLRVVTPALLQYWLRAWQPRQFSDWRDYAERVSGPDTLRQIEPPAKDAYIRALLNMTPDILSFPQREEVVLQGRREWFQGDAFRWMAIRGWYLRLYLETRFYSASPEETMAQIRQTYRDGWQELENIAAERQKWPAGELVIRAFRLLKQNAEAVCRAMECGAEDSGVQGANA